MPARLKNIALWAVALFVAFQFVQAAIPKVTGNPMMVQGFTHMGYPLWFMYVIGALELLGTAALLIPRTATFGAGILGAIMVGAVFTHARLGQPVTTPLVLLILVAIVGFARRNYLTAIFGRKRLPDARPSA